MLFGIFSNGHTVKSLQKGDAYVLEMTNYYANLIDHLATQQGDAIEQAIADREAVIRSLTDEILEIKELR